MEKAPLPFHELASASVPSLVWLFDAGLSSMRAWGALSNIPGMAGDRAANGIGNAEYERAGDICQQIAEEAARRSPATAGDRVALEMIASTWRYMIGDYVDVADAA